jgi:hypothetical protein
VTTKNLSVHQEEGSLLPRQPCSFKDLYIACVFEHNEDIYIKLAKGLAYNVSKSSDERIIVETVHPDKRIYFPISKGYRPE